MPRKKILQKRLLRLQNKKESLKQRALGSQDAAEVRSINEQLEDINAEIEETQDELNVFEEEERAAQQAATETRGTIPEGAQLINGGPIGTYAQGAALTQTREDTDPFATMEYRNAFMAYVQNGTPIPGSLTERAAGGNSGPTVSDDLGAIIPTTIMNEFISEVSKVYGQIYAKVRKLNIRGGVKFPVKDLKAKFKWITETTVSPNQNAGEIKDFIEFSYNMAEIRVSQTLLSTIVTLPMFESEITRIMVEAYVEAMDKNIVLGTGNGQMLGVLKDPRVTGNAGHTIEFTAAELADWTKWRKKLFSVIPLSKRGRGEFLFPASTIESYLLTMHDANNRPLFREATDITITDSNTAGKFFGRETTMVEPDVIADFDTAKSGDVIGLFWVPSDYVINTQYTFGIKRYFDDDSNEWVNKGLTVVDGKMLDVSGCYILKKK